jgi:class 3 adenylate cyclase
MMRASASPATARAFLRMQGLMDAREVLPLIRVPTLVLDRAESRLPKGPVDMPPLEEAHYIAERIPDAKHVTVPGRDYLPWVGDVDSIVAEVGRFVTGAAPVREPDRVLLTILFTDIVDSTKRAGELGDKRWRELLERHNALVRRHIEEYRGQEVDRAGDGFLTTFDGPARAIRCAQAIVASASRQGLEIRAGVHSGEVELLEQGIGGIAVHLGARVASLAEPGEVLVTTTVRDLVAGSGIEFVERGTHQLKGVPGTWDLLSAVPA